MGDWIWRHHWFVARTPSASLRVYERLEEIGWAMEAERASGLVTGLRFGLVSPTLVAATCTAKWGTHRTFQDEVTRVIAEPIDVIAGDTTESELAGSIPALAPHFAFAWSQEPAMTAALRATYPEVRFGAAAVFRLDAQLEELIYAGLLVPPTLPGAGRVVVGVACDEHGLVSLGNWDFGDGDPEVEPASLPTRLHAARTAGHGSWAITNELDHIEDLPDTYLDRPERTALDRHDALALWRPPAVRRRWIDDDLASVVPERRQTAAMMIRRFRWPALTPALVGLTADPSADVRAAAVLAVLELGVDGDDVREALERGLADGDGAVRARSAAALDGLRGGDAARIRATMSLDDRDDGDRVFDLQAARDAFAREEVNPWSSHTASLLTAVGDPVAPWLVAQLADPDARERALELIEQAGPAMGCLPAVRDALIALPLDGGGDDALALPRALAAWAPVDDRVRARLFELDAEAADAGNRSELIALQLGCGHPGLRAALAREAGGAGASAVVDAVLARPSPRMADLGPALIAILEHRPDDRDGALRALGAVWPRSAGAPAIPEVVRAVAEDVLVRWLGEDPDSKAAIRAVGAVAPLGVLGVPVLAKMTTLARAELAHAAALTIAFAGEPAQLVLARRWPAGTPIPPTVRFALGRVPATDEATLPELCGRAASGAEPAPGFADRALELAGGLGRGAYWRVRGGSPGRDPVAPPTLAALVRTWSGELSMKADRVILWADAVAAAVADRDLAIAHAVVALDNAMAATCDNPSWVTPPVAWIDRTLAMAWDGDAPELTWLDLPSAAPPDPHDPRIGDAAAMLLRAEGLDPAAGLPVFEAAADLAAAAGADRLAERARFRWLGALIAAADPASVAALAAFLDELAPPLLVLPQRDRAEHGGWTANYLAWLLHERGDSRAALPISDHAALLSDHDDAAVLDTLARVRLAAGDADGARAAVRWMRRFCPAASELAALAALTGT